MAARSMAAALLLALSAPSVGASRTKITPVQQVLQSLTEMKSKAGLSMDSEQKIYAQYKEWVSDRTQAIGFELKTGESDIEKLTAFADQADNKVASLGDEVNSLDNDISRATAEKNEATSVRQAEHADYVKIQQDYSESVDALDRAIQVLSAQDFDRAQAEVMLQKMAKTTRGMRRVMAALIQEQAHDNGAPAVAAYEFQSNNIVATLKGLLTKFKSELDDVESEEAEKAHYYDLEMIHLGDTIKKTNSDRDEKAATRAKTAASSAKAKGELADTKKELASDKKLLSDMTATFQAKTDTFHTNQQVRKDELEALAKAIEIISNPTVADSYAEHINLAQVSKQTTLLQMRSSKRRVAARQRAAEFLKKRAGALSSRALQTLANQVTENPFAKVVDMIEDLLAKLKEQASSEADHKSWCDEQLKANKLKRDKRGTNVEEIMAEIEALTGNINTMGKTIDTLVKDQADLATAMNEATAMRTKEKAENKDTMADAQAGAEAVKRALVVLTEFYASQASLMQKSVAHQVPEMEAYKGLQGSKKGVVGMLEVIRSDFLRLESDTRMAEEQASSEYQSFMVESKADKTEKHEREVKTRLEKDQGEFDRGQLEKDLQANQEELAKANDYRSYLVPNCLEVHVNYAERVAQRKEEIASLKEAWKILDSKSAA